MLKQLNKKTLLIIVGLIIVLAISFVYYLFQRLIEKLPQTEKEEIEKKEIFTPEEIQKALQKEIPPNERQTPISLEEIQKALNKKAK